MVLFKVRPEASSEDIERMLAGLRTLGTRVPSVLELTCGTNLSSRNQGFTHGLFVSFRSREDLDAYISHPEHQRVVAERVRPITENIIVVDYEV